MVDNIAPSYLYQKRGVWYFTKHVPCDVKEYHAQRRIIKSLRTKNVEHAIRLSQTYLGKLEAFWLSIRMQHMDFLLRPPVHTTETHKEATPTLNEAKKIYITLKGKGRPKTFHQAAERYVSYVIDALGNRQISAYKSSDAAKFRDILFEKGLGSASVTRALASVRAIINITMQEHGLDFKNAFAGTYIPNKNETEDRKPIPVETIIRLQHECYKADDSLRHLVALISDTGMRMSEATGLIRSDLHLEGDTPYIDLKPHSWRRLKTTDSSRKIPLIGASLWAAQRLAQHENHLFPQYNKTDISNGNSASAAANKWLRSRVPEGCVMHSFRHSMRDRLRAVECPAEIINQIGGWQTAGVGERYGEGHPVKIMGRWMKKINFISTHHM